MSTRCIVGVWKPGRKDFDARYCHGDGYPEGVGATITHNWQTNFNGDTQKVVDFLLSTKVGWSSLVGTDFRKSPTWKRPKYDTPEYEAWDVPCWYDDRDGEEDHDPITKTSDLGWVQYAYLFDLEADVLGMYKVKNGNLTLLNEVSNTPKAGNNDAARLNKLSQQFAEGMAEHWEQVFEGIKTDPDNPGIVLNWTPEFAQAVALCMVEFLLCSDETIEIIVQKAVTARALAFVHTFLEDFDCDGDCDECLKKQGDNCDQGNDVDDFMSIFDPERQN
jgi:hypothetical protein